MKNLIYIILIFFACVFISCSRSEELKYGKKAPGISLLDTKGQIIKLNSFKGKIVVLWFWHKSCAPCLTKMILLDSLEKELKNDIVVLAINMGDDNQFISSYKSEHNISYSMLMDQLLIVTKKYKVTGSPSSFIIDKQGILREIIIGEIKINKLKKKILSYL